MVINEMTEKECGAFLASATLGRLACSLDNQPYVLPIYFAYEPGYIYVLSTLGQKIEWMRANPKVCVEVDEIANCLLYTSLSRVSRFCAREERDSHRDPVCFLWIISGNIPLRRQGIRLGFRARASARQRSGLVQCDGWVDGIGGKHYCWAALGPDWPCGRVLLWRNLCCNRQHRTAGVGSGQTEQTFRGSDSMTSRKRRMINRQLLACPSGGGLWK